jgi:hypothetical protein
VTSEAEYAARVYTGDRSVVRELLDRDHAAAALLADVLAAEDPRRVVSDAWEDLLGQVAAGTEDDDLRAALFRRVAAAAGIGGSTGGEPHATRLGTFVPSGDRWEGWWDKEPPGWPAGTELGPARVRAAIRRLPPSWRALLVMRDVAGLSAEQTAAALPAARTDQATQLEWARDAYLIEIDRAVLSR